MEENKTKYTPEELTQRTRGELRQMLTAELSTATSEIDDEFVRLLLVELQNRGDDLAFIDDESVETACKKFRQDTKCSPKFKKRWHQSWLLKVASVVLVLGVLFFSLPAAEAKNMPEVLTWWSNSLFQFFRPGQKPNIEEFEYKTDHPGLQQIYDAITEVGITEQIVPSSLSAEFKLSELKILQMQGDISVYTRLISDSNKILFTAIAHSEQAMLQHEKKAENISVWNIANIDHYVISNNNTWIITWVADNIECTITTDCLEEDVYRLIYSIYYLSED